MYNKYYDMDKDEYEEYYGEKIVTCRIHRRTDIDYCIACEEERIDEGRFEVRSEEE